MDTKSDTEPMMVSVLMPTYGHEPYIAQAIESFLAQEVDFPVELIINDDCSKDQTFAIAQRYAEQYPTKIRAYRQEQNHGLMRNYEFILQKAQGKYLAVLESDDYWIDTHKLQKQVDYLEAHPNCHLSCTGVWFLRDGGKMKANINASYLNEDKRKTPYEHIFYRNVIFSPSVVFRRAAYDQYCNIQDYIALGFRTFDYPVWLSLLANGELYYIPENTAVYRVMSTSISNTTNLKKRMQFLHSIFDIQDYLVGLYGQGRFTNFQIRFRRAVLSSRSAWLIKRPLAAAWYFFSMLLFPGLIHKRKVHH